MGVRYSNEAIQYCQELYFQFNGGNYERIEAEMRKKWPGWSRNNLYSKGKGKKRRPGWVEMYGWEEGLRLRRATSGEAVGTSVELLFLEIESMRRLLKKEINAKGAEVTRKENRDLIYQHEHYCKLSIDALARLDAGRNLGGFASLWQDLMDWLPAISQKALRELLRPEVADAIMARAKQKYADAGTEK